MPTAPTFAYERQYWQQGIAALAGVDEVGMGALAGPVCAAAVVFENAARAKTTKQLKIRDSKTLSAKQREEANEWIQTQALTWAVGTATVDEITRLNIRKAAHLAMRRAIEALSENPDLILLDGAPAQIHPTIPAVNIIDGDALCFSIAAASIIAKVHRDEIMVGLDAQFPEYGFASHKGYGSKHHLKALRDLGPTPHHRLTYAPVRAASV